MDELLNSITALVKGALDAAGDLAGAAGTAATGAAQDVLKKYEEVYQAYLAQGMPPEEAADAAERYLRQVYGINVI